MEESQVPPGPEPGQAQPDQEELQRRLEEQLRQVRVQDLLLESVASILNLSARRIAKQDERDLEQGRLGIDAVRAVLELLEPSQREQVREALSQVQMLYAREAQGGAGEAPERPGEPAPERPTERPGEPAPEQPQPERHSRLWTPPGT